MFGERAPALALLLLLASAPVGGSELLAIDEELPAEEVAAEWSAGRWSAALAGSHDGGGAGRPRARLLWDLGAWRGIAALSPGSAAPWRGGLRGGNSGWSFAAGTLEGDWGDGLLLGRRRRAGLGRISAPVAAKRPLSPGAGGRALGRGVAAEWRSADGECGLAWLDLPDGGECLLLSLGGRGVVVRAMLGDGSRGLGVSTLLRGERRTLRLSLAWGARAGAPPRPAMRWRFGYGTERIGAALAGLAVVGSSVDVLPLRGWLGADPGRELHAALFGEEAGVDWRLALRDRAGLGLPEGETRREAGLDLSAPLRNGRAVLRLRRIATLAERPLLAAPGFPRSEAEESLKQELSCGWRGAWSWRWTWRGGPGGAGSRELNVSIRSRGVVCRMRLFSVARGMAPLVHYDIRALTRRVESLDGSGWRLTLSGRRSLRSVSARLGCSYTGRAASADEVAVWAEIRLVMGAG